MKKVLAIAVVADFLWAVIVATFFSTIITTLFHLGHASSGASTLSGILAWLFAFVVAGLQGAIFLLVVGLIVGGIIRALK